MSDSDTQALSPGGLAIVVFSNSTFSTDAT